MTHVRLSQDGTRCAVSCEGHATGSVEVCAAVSMLIQTAAAWARGSGAVIFDLRLDPGDARLEYDADDDGLVLLDVLHVGFALLARRYPDIVELETTITA